MQYQHFILITAIVCLSISYNAEAQTCSLPLPSDFQVTAITDCEATVSWNSVPGASKYGVKYKIKGQNSWSPVVKIGLNTSYTFAGLAPGTTYKLAVAAFCDNNKNSGFNNLKASTLPCTPPVISQVEVIGPQSVHIEWDGNGCSSAFNQIRYKQLTDASWTFVSTGNNTSILLQNLTAGVFYTFQVSDCADTSGSWSLPGTFQITARPNILVIILDDARYDSYSCNGGPAFFQSPNIDRIANEGVNFKTSFCTEALCIPSRASIVTGLYPHNHGATTNSGNSTVPPDLPTTAKILDSAGYYTAWIGKYHMEIKPVEGYDYWLGTKVNSGTDEYNNLKYNYNGTLKTINGHDTDVITDSTLAFLDRNADKNFFATIGYHAPHIPYIPQSSYAGIYDGEQMPVPSNTAHYESNYPSFLYDLGQSYYIDSSEIPNEYEGYFEMMAGLDEGIGEIIQKLTDLSLLNNTLIIFTSDNGMMFGEHGLLKKHFAYEPSIRVPLFMRYPAWFAESTVITNQMALNVDIAPTILEAAGINGNYSFDGKSLRAIADGSATRTSMYYESIYDPSAEKLPFIRAVRTLNAKLTQYGCSQVTEEFFNLTMDPLENTNQINNAAYSTAIQNLRNQLNAFKIQLNDTAQETILFCFLNPGFQKNERLFIGDPEDLPSLEDNVRLYPVPASEQLTIAFLSPEEIPDTRVFISDELGRILLQETVNVVKGENIHTLSTKALNAGYFFITITAGSSTITKPIAIVK